MKRALYLLSGILILLSAAIAGGSFYMLDYSLCPANNSGKDTEGSYAYMFTEYPFIKPWADSLKQTGALRDTFILRNGIRLHALYAEAPQPTRRTALIIHGYTDSAVRMLMIGYLYHHDLEFNILLPDLYGGGESEGEHIRMGWLDRHDVRRWAEVAHTMFGDSTQIVVHGISMGAATAMMMAGDAQPDYVRCFVEDCGYTSVWDEFSKELKVGFGLPEIPMLYTTNLLCKWLYGWDFHEASALKQIEKSRHPVFFIHGDADDYVPTWMVYTLYKAKKQGDKELWIVSCTAHAVSYRDNREEYTQRVSAFVGKYL